MAQAVLRHFAFSLATTGLLMGCVEGAGSGAATDGGTTPAFSAASRTGTGRDVEAPDVYQTTDTALWDGRPSLGGIWVASPDVTDPERVVMVNPANGKTVTGALFRRERDNPGPALQMSSDAAEALGMLAGQPAEIRVTALRRDEPEAPVEAEAAAAPAATPEAATPETATPEAATEEPAADADAAAVATAATAALGVADSAVPGTEADPSATVDPTAGEATTEEPPKRKTWKERRAEAKAAREAKKAAAAAAAAAVAVDDTETATATADTVAVDAIETAPLDARSAEATAPVEAAAADTAGTEPVVTEAAPSEPPKTRRQKREEAAAAAAAEAAAAEAPAPAPAAAGRPIQVASFSKEENAERAVQALSKIGITAQPQKSETNGKVVWGVVALGDADMLKSIRSAGFADAFFLK